MTEDEYKKEMDILWGMLEGVNKNVDYVSQRLANGALLSSPREYKNPELFAIHEKLTDRASQILDKLQDLHKQFNRQP